MEPQASDSLTVPSRLQTHRKCLHKTQGVVAERRLDRTVDALCDKIGALLAEFTTRE
jgi:hypothetical protein